MTLEERVARLEQRLDQLDRIESSLDDIDTTLKALRADFGVYANSNARVLERILATLQDLQRRPSFRWPWESR